MGEPRNPAGQEQHEGSRGSGIHVRAMRLGGLAIVAGVLLSLGGAWLLARGLGPADNSAAPPQLATPRLQPAPQEERAAYFAAKEARLQGWGWVDREAGIAHIPLEQAMQLMASRTAGKGHTGGGKR